MRAMGGAVKPPPRCFLQVTPDLPDPAQYEADRHRGSLLPRRTKGAARLVPPTPEGLVSGV